ncbi:hisA [Acrasis kona]|uniref:HisA n=1 Tax=Acrasis kona TaxID=1008807 RepID=A0AAW2Z3F2_9EUKA
MKTLFAVALLFVVVTCFDPSCSYPRYSGNKVLSYTPALYKMPMNVLNNVDYQRYLGKVKLAQKAISLAGFEPKAFSREKFRGQNGVPCIKCQVDCMSNLQVWKNGNKDYYGSLFHSCQKRYLGYGCREHIGCIDLKKDYSMLYRGIYSCIKGGGCKPKYWQMNPNIATPSQVADFLGSVTGPIQGDNSPPGKSA